MGTYSRGQPDGAEGSSQAVASEGMAGRNCRWVLAGTRPAFPAVPAPTAGLQRWQWLAGAVRGVGQVAQRGEDSDGGSGERQTRGLSSPPGQRGECCSKDRTRWKADNRHWREARREKSSGVVPPSVRK